MNKTRRKAIAALIETLEGALSEAQDIAGDETDEFENLSERAQQNEKGEERQQAISSLDDAVSSIESAIESLREASGE